MLIPPVADKVWMYEEIMTNDDNLESNLLTSSLLKMCSLYKLNWRSLLFTAYCPVAGDELIFMCTEIWHFKLIIHLE